MGPWVSSILFKFKYSICTWIRHSRCNNGRWIFPINVRSKAFLWQWLFVQTADVLCVYWSDIDHELCKLFGPSFFHVLLSGIPSFLLSFYLLVFSLPCWQTCTYVMPSPLVERNKARFPLMLVGSNYLLVSKQALTAVWWTFFTEQL
jgi:hypothetical protein